MFHSKTEGVPWDFPEEARGGSYSAAWPQASYVCIAVTINIYNYNKGSRDHRNALSSVWGVPSKSVRESRKTQKCRGNQTPTAYRLAQGTGATGPGGENA